MGGQVSKEEHITEQLKLAEGRIKSCMENHHSNVRSIESAINAQKDSVEILSRMIPTDFREQQDTERKHPKNELFETSQNLLANIQNTLVHQAGSLCKSFDILHNCIREISAPYSPDSGSSFDKARRTEVPVKTRISKGKFDTMTYESEGHTDSAEFCTSGADSRDSEIDMSVQILRAENKMIISRNNELQKNLNDAEDKIIVFQKENEHLKSTVKQNEEKIRLLTMQKKDLNDQNMKLDSERMKLSEENLKHRKDANARYSLEHQLRDTQNSNYTLQRRVDELSRKVNDLEDEKRKMKERKMNVPVQLFYQRRDELMTLVVNELSAMLETQMQTKSIQLEIVRCENISSIQPDKPILVLCINSSRLGTDASTAIEGVQKSGRTALLIFHHKNIHALPNQPSDRMLTSSEFKQLGGIFDLAFLSGKGIYPCDMNNLAMGCIESFIQKDMPGK